MERPEGAVVIESGDTVDRFEKIGIAFGGGGRDEIEQRSPHRRVIPERKRRFPRDRSSLGGLGENWESECAGGRASALQERSSR